VTYVARCLLGAHFCYGAAYAQMGFHQMRLLVEAAAPHAVPREPAANVRVPASTAAQSPPPSNVLEACVHTHLPTPFAIALYLLFPLCGVLLRRLLCPRVGIIFHSATAPCRVSACFLSIRLARTGSLPRARVLASGRHAWLDPMRRPRR
jgi:hypothetical protein